MEEDLNENNLFGERLFSERCIAFVTEHARGLLPLDVERDAEEAEDGIYNTALDLCRGKSPYHVALALASVITDLCRHEPEAVAKALSHLGLTLDVELAEREWRELLAETR